MQVKIKKLADNAVVPSYAHSGDAGMDITATTKVRTPDYIEYGTGLAFAIPAGFVGLVFPRSSISKKDLMLCNSIGVIDSNFRGEVKARFKYGSEGDHYEIGDRVCQMIVMPYPTIELAVVDDLDDTDRGAGGFGSSGT